MSNRLKWDGIDIGEFSEADLDAMRMEVARDWRVYAQQGGNVVATVWRAGGPLMFASCTVLFVLLGSAGIFVPRAMSIVLKGVFNDTTVLEQLASYILGGIGLFSFAAGVLRAARHPNRFGFENKFTRATIDRLTRRYLCVESGVGRAKGARIIRG